MEFSIWRIKVSKNNKQPENLYQKEENYDSFFTFNFW